MSAEIRPDGWSFRPAILVHLHNYNRQKFLADLTAGFVVGLVALPLAIAFGINSGVTPQAGLWTAVIAGLIVSILGGTRMQISGPTGAFVPVLYSIVVLHGVENLLLATFLAGIILLVMGAARLGSVIKFIPYPVTMGFTSGIAVVIFSQQVKDLLGLELADGEKLPGHAFEQWAFYLQHWQGLSPLTCGFGLFLVIVMFAWPKKWGRRVPASLVVLLGGTLLSALLGWSGQEIATVGTRFQNLSSGWPEFRLPDFHLEALRTLLWPATTIAFLGAIESLLSAVVADSLTDDKHDSNQELMAQGLANIVAPLFGGIASTGAIARTATNIRNGARTPISGIVHALTLLTIIFLAANLARQIPMVVLAAILVFVSYNMGEWHIFQRLGQMPRSDALVFLTTFGLTVLADLMLAVGVGMILASVLFIKRVAEMSEVSAYDEATVKATPGRDDWIRQLPRGVDVFRLQGAFFFGTAEKLETAFRRSQQDSTALILILDQAISLDATGLQALESLHKRLISRRKRLILCGIRPKVHELLQKSGFIDRIGAHNVTETLFAAILKVKTLSTEEDLGDGGETRR